MKLVLSTWASLSLLASAALADVSFFNNPPRSDDPNDVDFANNPVYAMSDSIDVQWSSDFETITLLVEQKDNDFRPVLVDSKPNPGSANWTVSYNDFGTKLNSNSMMRFLLFQVPTQNHVYSQFFNLSAPPPVVSTSSAAPSSTMPVPVIHMATSATPTTFATSTLATSTSGLTSSSAVATTGGSAAAATAGSATSSLPNPSATSSALDAGTQAGLGVGLGVGIPLLGLLGAIVYLLLRRRKREYKPHGQAWPPAPGQYPPSYTSSPTEGFANQPQMHAVPILQPPPPARHVLHHPTNENGYAPPSALLKPWPEAPLEGIENTKTYDAYGRSKGRLNEVPGDFGYGAEMAGERTSFEPKELPALPLTPNTPTRRERELRLEAEEQRLKRLIG